MEVKPPTKGLPKHALPIIMLMLALLTVSGVELDRAIGNSSTQTALARGLVTRVLHVRPTRDGLAQITFSQPPVADQNSPAGANLAGPDQAGQAAQMSLELQSPLRQ